MPYPVAASVAAVSSHKTVVASNPATAAAVVAGAGTATSNGTYPRAGDQSGKAFYDAGGGHTIAWVVDSGWFIGDDELGAPSYFSSDDTTYPWQVVTWQPADGAEPVPTVTMGV